MKKNRYDRTRRCSIVRPVALAACMMASVSITACGGKKAPSAADYIGIDAAKEAALKASELSAGEIDFLSAELDSEDGAFYYQVVFTENGTEHMYEIDALTGSVIKEVHSAKAEAEAVNSGQSDQVQAAKENEKQTNGEGQAAGERLQAAAGREQTASESSQAANGKKQAASGEASSKGTGTSQGIGADEALSTARSHAGLAEADIRFDHTKTDTENGRLVYDVEFTASDGTEYEYEISGEDGRIISYELDAESLFRQRSSAGGAIVSESQAKQAVLDRISGAEAENVWLELDEDDGRMEYEGKLVYDSMKYEFKIDAYSGGLMELEAELIGY